MSPVAHAWGWDQRNNPLAKSSRFPADEIHTRTALVYRFPHCTQRFINDRRPESPALKARARQLDCHFIDHPNPLPYPNCHVLSSNRENRVETRSPPSTRVILSSQ